MSGDLPIVCDCGHPGVSHSETIPHPCNRCDCRGYVLTRVIVLAGDPEAS